MADTNHQGAVNILETGTNLNDSSEIVTIAATNVVGGVEVNEDILQQALQEASGSLEHVNGTYAPGQVSVADGITISGDSIVNAIGDGNVIYTLGTSDHHTTQSIHAIPGLGTHQIVQQVDENGEVTSFLQQIQDAVGDEELGSVHMVGGMEDHLPMQVQQEATSASSDLQQLADTVDLQSVEMAEKMDSIPHMGEQSVIEADNQEHQPTITMLTSNLETLQGLGSSQNPIRIIQQGNQYTSLQHLTQEQLTQIMQVVQQQQLMKATEKEGSSSVLYNPQTQTRIVYKVIYPAELHKKAAMNTCQEITSSSTSTSGAKPLQIRVPTDMLTLTSNYPMKRTYRKRKHEDDEKVDSPNFTQEEKEERKKQRPRTRSGRVSRPPRHMVKDYKHIHPVDWDQDYDDSNGGYSDFKLSEDEDGTPTKRKRDNNYTPYNNLASNKHKPWKCDNCEKSYIGRAGLARHYRLHPDHGQADELMKDALNAEDGQSGIGDSSNSQDMAMYHFDPQDGITQHAVADGGYSEPPLGDQIPGTDPGDKPPDGATEDQPAGGATGDTLAAGDATTAVNAAGGTVPGTTSSTAGGPTPATATPALSTSPATASTTATATATAPAVHANPLRGVLKAKQSLAHESMPARRRHKLQELVRQCEDEDLMELVLPRLAKVITTWEFLLMKTEDGNPAYPRVVDVLQEYAAIQRNARKMCQEQLRSATAPEGASHTQGGIQIQISDEVMAHSLGLEPGTFFVRSAAKPQPSNFQYKLLTSDPDRIHASPMARGKRHLEVVARKDLVQSPLARKPKMAPSRTAGDTGPSATEASRSGSEVTEPGSEVTEPGSEVTEPGSEVTEPESENAGPETEVTRLEAEVPGLEAEVTGPSAAGSGSLGLAGLCGQQPPGPTPQTPHGRVISLETGDYTANVEPDIIGTGLDSAEVHTTVEATRTAAVVVEAAPSLSAVAPGQSLLKSRVVLLTSGPGDGPGPGPTPDNAPGQSGPAADPGGRTAAHLATPQSHLAVRSHGDAPVAESRSLSGVGGVGATYQAADSLTQSMESQGTTTNLMDGVGLEPRRRGPPPGAGRPVGRLAALSQAILSLGEPLKMDGVEEDELTQEYQSAGPSPPGGSDLNGSGGVVLFKQQTMDGTRQEAGAGVASPTAAAPAVTHAGSAVTTNATATEVTLLPNGLSTMAPLGDFHQPLTTRSLDFMEVKSDINVHYVSTVTTTTLAAGALSAEAGLRSHCKPDQHEHGGSLPGSTASSSSYGASSMAESQAGSSAVHTAVCVSDATSANHVSDATHDDVSSHGAMDVVNGYVTREALMNGDPDSASTIHDGLIAMVTCDDTERHHNGILDQDPEHFKDEMISLDPETGATHVLIREHRSQEEEEQGEDPGGMLQFVPGGDLQVGQCQQQFAPHPEEVEFEEEGEAQVLQTSEGLILIRQPDGTIQIHGQNDQPIPLESIQALLGIDPSALIQIDESTQQFTDQS